MDLRPGHRQSHATRLNTITNTGIVDLPHHANKPDVNALIVSPPTSVWGAQLYLLDQVEPLRARGVMLTLASPAGSAFTQQWRSRGFPVLNTPVHLHEGLRKSGSESRPGVTSVARTCAGVTRGVGTIGAVSLCFDMMYSFSMRSHLEVAIAGRRTNTPVALDLVNIVRPGIGRRALRAAARLATLTVANSQASAAALGHKSKVRIIQPGIDLHRFHPGPRDENVHRELTGGVDRPLVAIIGRIDIRKGVHTLVEAMGMVSGEAAQARLVVVGEAGTGPTEYADQLARQASEALGDRVLFTGRRSDIPAIMRSVDLVVVASVAEPFGLSALEAQACGTPVVGTNSGGLIEFVQHEVTGFLAPPLDARALARAIERVFDEPTLTANMAREAEDRANPSRGLEAQFDDLAAMYRDVATRAVTND